MNNIEILEEFIKYFEAEATGRKYRRNISITVGEDDIEAIENLIQRNKNLEQIEKEHKEENGRLREELENIEYIKRNFDYCLEQKIKEGIELKVKEKMQELDKEEKEAQESISDEEREEYSDASIGYLLMNIETRRNALQELLEESEK